jgi:hypothetical protein
MADYYNGLDMREETLKAMRKHEAEIVDLNTNQLMNGKDSQGSFLKEYRSAPYAAFKRTLNPKGVTDLKLSGDFHDGFFMNANKFPIIFDSKDTKTGMLTDKYGEDIFGLDKNSLAEAATYVKAELGEVLRIPNNTI